MSTQDCIRPILYRVYGKTEMVDSLVVRLAEVVDTFEARREDETRYDRIRETCWMWFSGGGTAASVAGQIEAALEADGYPDPADVPY